jgi:hypothetical protein
MYLLNYHGSPEKVALYIILLYIVIGKVQFYLFADWSKPYHVPVHKMSCSLRALPRRQPVHNETFIDRSIIKWVQYVYACQP